MFYYLLAGFIGSIIGFFLAALVHTASDKYDERELLSAVPIQPDPPPPPPPAKVPAPFLIYAYEQLVPPNGLSWDVGDLRVIVEEEGVLMVNSYRDTHWVTPGDLVLIHNIQPVSTAVLRGGFLTEIFS